MVEDTKRNYLPDMFPMNQHKEAEFDHVPLLAAVITHQVECHRNMGVAVVTAKVMLQPSKKIAN